MFSLFNKSCKFSDQKLWVNSVGRSLVAPFDWQDLAFFPQETIVFTGHGLNRCK